MSSWRSASRKRKPDVFDDDLQILGSQPVSKASRLYRPNPGPLAPLSGFSNSRDIINLDLEGSSEEILDLTNDEFDDETYNGYEHYGTLSTKIVGIRFYNGHANRGEYVFIRREPTNPYDPNAIRVINVLQEQIGHLPRETSVKLTPYMDFKKLLVEGVLTGSLGTYDCPIAIKLFGPTDPILRADLRLCMKSDCLPTRDVDQREQEAVRRKTEEARARRAAAQASKANQIKREIQTQQDMKENIGARIPAPGPSFEEMVTASERFNPRKLGQAVEKFGSGEEVLKNMPMAESPNSIVTKMLPYQRQGLAWMFKQENPTLPARGSKDVVQLWKRSEISQMYTNIATNCSMATGEPILASGGILADDMGLGKTLQVISLILADRESTTGSRDMATLILSPLSVMSNWSGQIKRHLKPECALRVLIYHSVKKPLTPADLANYDVVITTYGTLAAEYLPRGAEKPSPVPRKIGLYSIRWRRIVLDEGHIVRNPETKTAKAVCAIDSRSRWVLSGTPIFNTLKDLYSYIKFLKVTGGLEDLQVFRSTLMRPFQNGSPEASLLLKAVMSNFCLRRKKEMSFVDLRLPELNEYIHRVTFVDHEKKIYDALEAQARGEFDLWVNSVRGADGAAHFRHLFELLLRLRQVCNHWKLCEKRVTELMEFLENGKTVELTPDNTRALQDILQLSIENQDDCPICYETLGAHNPVITACGHSFGQECIERAIELQHKCPMCRAELKDKECLVQPLTDLGEAKEELNLDINTSSSKIDALMTILRASHRKADAKIVVFSQWTSFLNIVEKHLLEHGYRWTRIDGTMTASARDEAMVEFEQDSGCTIMLASLAVCSVGLNLVAANQVILSDSWWAPSVEDQAVDRIHRLGQTRPTTVWRIVVEGSIEERVLDIQAKKRELISAAFNEKSRSTQEIRAARRADIQRLLG